MLVAILTPVAVQAEEMTYGAFSVERFEHHFESGLARVDISANYGTDEHQFVANLESELIDSDSLGELQLLYSRPVSAYFDLQLGVEVSNHSSSSRTAAVIGIEGTAPYRIETEAQLVVTKDGDVVGKFEIERDFLLTQSFVLQPRIKFAVQPGSSSLLTELRARYEVTRKFAPYLGLSWEKPYGDAAADGESTAIAGLSFWF